MKKILYILIVSAIILAGSALECKAQLSKLKINSYKIESISPNSFRSVSGAALFNITNPLEDVFVSAISGTIYKQGQPFISGTAGDFTIVAGTGNVRVNGNAALCSGVSLWSVFALLAFNPEDYAVDVNATVRIGNGQPRVISVKKMPVSSLLKKM